MAVFKRVGVVGPATVGLLLGAFALFAGEASAAPPIVCVRNATGIEIEVVAGVQADRQGKPGVYLGKARARGGACRYADIDGEMNVSFRRAVRRESPGEPFTEIHTADGGWIACPAQGGSDGWYVFTVRRARSALICKPGGDARGLEGPGEYE
ncbi:MAG: hypothetical protein IV086_09315 [Hyphomonadaceae bacterium]|nr:MAG: hypothetical protein FD160_274 [Caulobacteraceae bacterium]MBT9445882.1 hypothetical protein [Hyphomonadaceae bacterium]TPW08546.1 MAG: hypothetical protein FD124_288 [Alphaproteobacteria bacterium]